MKYIHAQVMQQVISKPMHAKNEDINRSEKTRKRTRCVWMKNCISLSHFVRCSPYELRYNTKARFEFESFWAKLRLSQAFLSQPTLALTLFSLSSNLYKITPASRTCTLFPLLVTVWERRAKIFESIVRRETLTFFRSLALSFSAHSGLVCYASLAFTEQVPVRHFQTESFFCFVSTFIQTVFDSLVKTKPNYNYNYYLSKKSKDEEQSWRR